MSEHIQTSLTPHPLASICIFTLPIAFLCNMPNQYVWGWLSSCPHNVFPEVNYKSRGTKSSNLTNDSIRCRRTQPVKINLLDMAAVSFKLVVETADGNKRAEYKPSSDWHQKLGWLLNEFEDSVSNFSIKTASKFGLPPYLTQVTFGGSTINKTDTSFWQILVKNHNMITPVALYNYVVKDGDQIILRYMTVSQ
ncbi:unnamed protein product [Arctogadus glacialis]